MILTEDIRSM